MECGEKVWPYLISSSLAMSLGARSPSPRALQNKDQAQARQRCGVWLEVDCPCLVLLGQDLWPMLGSWSKFHFTQTKA